MHCQDQVQNSSHFNTTSWQAKGKRQGEGGQQGIECSSVGMVGFLSSICMEEELLIKFVAMFHSADQHVCRTKDILTKVLHF
jgi:hypothetical protein